MKTIGIAALVICIVGSAPAYGDEAAQTHRSMFADPLKTGGSGPRMISVNGGRFRMGCTSGLACKDNTPVHEVSVSPFAMSVHEITRGEFGRFIEQTAYVTDAEQTPTARPMFPFGQSLRGCTGFLGRGGSPSWGHTWMDPGYPQTDQHPVVCVSWADAQAYLLWLATETGKPYRLPTEAEWEYSARAGAPETVQDQVILSRISYCERTRKGTSNLGDIIKCTGAGYSQAVGRQQPNAFGLHDLEGNVMEWVEDCWNPNYRGAPGDGSARTKENCSHHVVRLDGFANWAAPFEARDRQRTHLSVSLRGFRVVLPTSN